MAKKDPTGASVVIVVIGAGLVGLASALELTRRGHVVTVVDKEQGPARHQSGRNSGVVHAGVYYPPGSAKATLCTQGRRALLDLCTQEGIAHDVCGKLIVATRNDELGRLDALGERARRNGLDVELISRAAVREREPHVDALAGLHVRQSAVVDFPGVAEVLADRLRANDATLRFSCGVERIEEHAHGVQVHTVGGEVLAADAVLNCAGVHADRLARQVRPDLGLRIVPFRGEYAELSDRANHLVNGLVYPVPDPALPFLGVHLTRDVFGRVHVGPNAVLALGREAYRWRQTRIEVLAELIGDPAVRAMARRWWRVGAGELARSLVPALALASARRLLPDLAPEDLRPSGSGIRAQAVSDDGQLMDDFALVTGRRSIHVCNAPSPAATACLAIGDHLAQRTEALLAAL